MGFIYFIKIRKDAKNTTANVRTPTKIGWVKGDRKKDVVLRFRTIQTGNHRRLIPVKLKNTKYYKQFEKYIKKRFANQRIYHEWFSLSMDEINEFIAESDDLEISFKAQKRAQMEKKIIARCRDLFEQIG